MKEFIEKHYKKILILIFIIAIIVRIYQIGILPRGIHVDEAAMAYDAMCLAEYGVDRYLNQNPVYLVNFGGGQSVLYAYLAMVLIKIFGYSLLIVRLPALILSIVAIIAAWFLVKDNKSKTFALTFIFLIAICPWHIMQSRWGLDCNLLSSLLIISICLLSRAKRGIHYVIAGISFGITLYTYALSYIIVPIFLILTLAYLIDIKKMKFKDILALGIPLGILALPLILMILVNNHHIPEIKSFITIPELFNYRGTEISTANISSNLEMFKILLTKDFSSQSSINGTGTIYYLSIPFVIIGLIIAIKNTYLSVKNKEYNVDALILFSLIATTICLVLIDAPNISKANAIFIPLLYLAALGIAFICRYSKKIFPIIIALYIIYFGYFSYNYFYLNKDKVSDPFFQESYTKVIRHLNVAPYTEDKIIHLKTQFSVELMDKIVETKSALLYKRVEQPYIYILLENKVSPYDFVKSMKRNEHGVTEYDQYRFHTMYNDLKEINDEDVYVVRIYDDINSFIERGFKHETIDEYYIFYK